MDLNVVLQLAVSGLLTGALYGLAALGLALAFGVLKVLNVAHGELIMLGGYATFILFDTYGVHPLVALPLVFLIMMAVGLVLHLVLFRFVVRLGIEDRIKNSLLISFGLVLILQSLASRAFTADERSINLNLTSWAVGPVRLPPNRVAVVVIAVLATVVLEWTLRRTTFGRAIRATSEDWTLALLSGINIQRVYLVTFALAAGLAGIAGTAVASVFTISPHIGLFWTLNALIVIVLAGLGSIRGTVIAGMLLGLIEGVSSVWVGSEYREVVALVVLLVVLMVKPEGLTGEVGVSAHRQIVAALVALAVVAALPLVPALGDSSKWMTIAILTFVVAALASSWNILGGFAGQISLGQAAFFGVGAHITRETWLGGWPLPLSLLVGTVVTMVGAAVIGVPMLRLRGIYFSIGTLAAAEALRITVGNLRPGISSLPADALATYTYGPRYYLALGVLALAVALAMWLRRSKLGLGMMTQRDDEQAAGATGVNVFGHRMAAFVLSAGLAALAGGAFAYFFISYYPVYPFTVVWSFDAILVTFIGGFGTIVGPIIGSVFFVIVRDALSGYLAEFQVVGFGVLFILVVILFPGGIVEAGRRLAGRMSRRGIEDPDKEREEST